MALATAAIDVHPPRAGRWSRSVPRFWGLKQAWGNLSSVVVQPFQEYFAGFEDTNFDLSTIVRLAVPGWATWYRGRPARGLAFFVAYVGLLLTGLVLLGTGLGSVLLGLAFGVHSASAVDATIGKFADFSSRLMFTFGIGFGLLMLIYIPIGMLIGQSATPIQITQAIGDFRPGDVLWYDATTEIAPGQLVYYRVPETRVTGRTVGGQAANFVFQNEWINRVLAVGGQTVASDGKQVLLDGKPLEWRGNVELGLAPGETLLVPHGQLLIPPDTLIDGEVRFDPTTWRRVSLIPSSNVIGRIYFRSLPLSRMSALD